MARLYVLDYPFAMKYVWILVAVVILVRIDLVLHFFDKTTNKIQAPPEREYKSTDAPEKTEIISVENDVAIKSTPRKTFLNMLADYHTVPDSSIKERALN